MSHSRTRRIVFEVALLGVGACGGIAASHTSPHGSGAPADAQSTPPLSGTDGGTSSSPRDASGNPPAESDAAGCANTNVTFTLQLPGSASGMPSCLGSSMTCYSWIDVLGPGGEALNLDAPCGVTCGPGQCSLADCACEAAPPTSSNPTRSWDGTFYVSAQESDSCPIAFLCYDPTCASPGTYIAKMCASLLGDQDASENGVCMDGQVAASCVEVPFQWPPTMPGTIVMGSLQ